MGTKNLFGIREAYSGMGHGGRSFKTTAFEAAGTIEYMKKIATSYFYYIKC
jgi:hypothetical protein